MQKHILSSLGLIQVIGVDAEKFLQGQLTCDVREVNAQQYRLGAHCDPKGRVQATFRLFEHQEDYYFLLPKNVIPHLLQCLQKYAVFSKVKLDEVNAPEILELFGQTLWSDKSAWELQDILAGIPTIYPETIGEFTPHQINYQLINGVSFNKGCYTGQEIIARMHYLGKPKQQMYRVSFVCEHPPTPGTKIYNSNAQKVGTLVTAAPVAQNDYQALAVLQNDAITENLYVDSILLTLLDLPYTA